MFARGAYPSNLWQKSLDNVAMYSNKGDKQSEESEQDVAIYDQGETSDNDISSDGGDFE